MGNIFWVLPTRRHPEGVCLDTHVLCMQCGQVCFSLFAVNFTLRWEPRLICGQIGARPPSPNLAARLPLERFPQTHT